MSILVKNLRNNRHVKFDKGKFDDWCVYIVESDGTTKAPYDIDYFTDFQLISKHYHDKKLYHDFVSIYELTTKTVSETVLNLIDDLVMTYQTRHRVLMELWLTVIYAGMIAEENKANAILKKRLKRLGMYQLLILNFLPAETAQYSKGKQWRDLDEIMKQFGF
jgi:hypothetical protein